MWTHSGWTHNLSQQSIDIERMWAANQWRSAVTIEGEIYYVVGDPIYFESEEIEAMTFLEHAIPYIESKPEAGYYDPDLEMKYAKVEAFIVVIYMDKWFLFFPSNTVLSNP